MSKIFIQNMISNLKHKKDVPEEKPKEEKKGIHEKYAGESKSLFERYKGFENTDQALGGIYKLLTDKNTRNVTQHFLGVDTDPNAAIVSAYKATGDLPLLGGLAQGWFKSKFKSITGHDLNASFVFKHNEAPPLPLKDELFILLAAEEEIISEYSNSEEFKNRKDLNVDKIIEDYYKASVNSTLALDLYRFLVVLQILHMQTLKQKYETSKYYKERGVFGWFFDLLRFHWLWGPSVTDHTEEKQILKHGDDISVGDSKTRLYVKRDKFYKLMQKLFKGRSFTVNKATSDKDITMQTKVFIDTLARTAKKDAKNVLGNHLAQKVENIKKDVIKLTNQEKKEADNLPNENKEEVKKKIVEKKQNVFKKIKQAEREIKKEQSKGETHWLVGGFNSLKETVITQGTEASKNLDSLTKNVQSAYNQGRQYAEKNYGKEINEAKDLTTSIVEQAKNSTNSLLKETEKYTTPLVNEASKFVQHTADEAEKLYNTYGKERVDKVSKEVVKTVKETVETVHNVAKETNKVIVANIATPDVALTVSTQNAVQKCLTKIYEVAAAFDERFDKLHKLLGETEYDFYQYHDEKRSSFSIPEDHIFKETEECAKIIIELRELVVKFRVLLLYHVSVKSRLNFFHATLSG